MIDTNAIYSYSRTQLLQLPITHEISNSRRNQRSRLSLPPSKGTCSGPLEVQLKGVKESSLCAVIGGFLSTLSVSFVHGSLIVDVIMIDGSKRRSHQLGLEFHSLRVTETRNNAVYCCKLSRDRFSATYGKAKLVLVRNMLQ